MGCSIQTEDLLQSWLVEVFISRSILIQKGIWGFWLEVSTYLILNKEEAYHKSCVRFRTSKNGDLDSLLLSTLQWSTWECHRLQNKPRYIVMHLPPVDMPRTSPSTI